jgi:hypothetical protein
MKTISTILLGFIILINSAIAQTNKNGIIYDKHPAINIAEAFLQAYVTNNVEVLKKLADTGFNAYNNLTTNRSDKGKGINGLIEESKWLNNNMVSFSIKRRGTSYPDAFEYKDGAGLRVQTFDVFYWISKNTGFKVEAPYDCEFIFNKEGTKISRLRINMNTAAWQKASEMEGTTAKNSSVENGIIYKDHANIIKVRKLMTFFEIGKIKEDQALYNTNAIFEDVNSLVGKTATLEEYKKNVASLLEKFEVLGVDEIGYPDLLAYSGSDQVVLSWWVVRFKNKATNATIKVPVHYQHEFGADGSITKQSSYYNAGLLK